MWRLQPDGSVPTSLVNRRALTEHSLFSNPLREAATRVSFDDSLSKCGLGVRLGVVSVLHQTFGPSALASKTYLLTNKSILSEHRTKCLVWCLQPDGLVPTGLTNCRPLTEHSLFANPLREAATRLSFDALLYDVRFFV